MKRTIHKGAHYSWPPRIGIHYNRKIMQHQVCFLPSCRYTLAGEPEDWPVNKLFGFGYIKGGHHTDSARFGWRYSPAQDKIEIFSYCYVSGFRKFKSMCFLTISLDYSMEIFTSTNEYVFSIHKDGLTIGEVSETFYHSKRLQYDLGFYFGGSDKAPNTMQIDMI